MVQCWSEQSQISRAESDWPTSIRGDLWAIRRDPGFGAVPPPGSRASTVLIHDSALLRRCGRTGLRCLSSIQLIQLGRRPRDAGALLGFLPQFLHQCR